MKVFPINDKINEYDYDPDLGVGIPWIRKTVVPASNTLTHTLLQIGLTARAPTPTVSNSLSHTLLHLGLTSLPETYTLKVRNKNNEILKIKLEKEV